MACVSKPMRMKDFPFQLADTLFQYSLLKQLSKRCLDASSTAPQKNIFTTTVTGFDVHGPFSSPLLSNTPFFQMHWGLQQKIALHVLLPKAEDCERVDEWKREQHRAREEEMGCKIQRHAIHTVTSGTLVKNHNPKRKKWWKMNWKFDSNVWFLCIVPHCSIPSVRSWSLFFSSSLSISSPLCKASGWSTKNPNHSPRQSTSRSKTQSFSFAFFHHHKPTAWKHGNTKTPESPMFPSSLDVHQHFIASQKTEAALKCQRGWIKKGTLRFF